MFCHAVKRENICAQVCIRQIINNCREGIGGPKKLLTRLVLQLKI